MKNVTQKLSLTLAILLLTSTVAIYLPTANALDAVLSTSPDPVVKVWADRDTNFDLSVIVTDVLDLYGFSLKLEWDSALISYVSYDTTAGFELMWPGGSGTGWFKAAEQHGPGYFRLDVTSLAVEYDGTHELFKVQLHVEDPTCNSEKTTAISFTTHTLATVTYTPIPNTATTGLYKVTGKTPSINLGPATQTCHMSVPRTGPDVTEEFDVDFAIADAQSVMGFSFDVRYDTTHLDFVSLTFGDAWTVSPTYTPDEVGGKVTGSASAASGQNDGVALMTIRFKPTSLHIWKDASITPWTNDLTSNIYIQAATLTYSGAPDLGFVDGGSTNKILVPIKVAYTFSPIKGDITNDGEVELFDLVTLCMIYDKKETDPDWATAEPWDLVHLGGLKTIDIFDVIVIASNYGTEYIPPP